MLIKKQINSLKKKLAATKKDLEKQIKDLGIMPEFGTDTDHFEEEADEAEEFSKNAGIAEALKNRLNDVANASNKIGTSDYGRCEKCGKEIEFKILNIDPESRHCRNCKIKE